MIKVRFRKTTLKLFTEWHYEQKFELSELNYGLKNLLETLFSIGTKSSSSENVRKDIDRHEAERFAAGALFAISQESPELLLQLTSQHEVFMTPARNGVEALAEVALVIRATLARNEGKKPKVYMDAGIMFDMVEDAKKTRSRSSRENGVGDSQAYEIVMAKTGLSKDVLYKALAEYNSDVALIAKFASKPIKN
jgi:NACalpha-BTF3-like transcription factor